MRNRFDGNLSDNIRGVALADITTAINTLDHLLQYEQSAASKRNHFGGHKELANARASIGLGSEVAKFFSEASLMAMMFRSYWTSHPHVCVENASAESTRIENCRAPFG